MLSSQTENKTLKKILKDISEEVQKGSSLSGAMALHKQLPAILVNMVAAGEASGTLDESLEVMAVHFEKESKLQQKIQGAMIYPIIVCFFAVAVSWFLLVAVVPMFVGIFASAGAELPLPTRVILFLSNFLRNNGLVLFLGLVILAAAGKMYFSREESIITLHKNLLKVPLFGSLQLKSIAARFSRTLSTLMETGVEITEALEITGKVLGNANASKRMREVELKVREGKGLYAPVRELELFPPMVENMIVLGEESGTLSTMLNRAAEFYEEEVDKQVDILTALMEPAMIVVLGGVVGFIVLAMVLPMFDMLSLVG
jgi:type IV pilus assembly protein PilC